MVPKLWFGLAWESKGLGLCKNNQKLNVRWTLRKSKGAVDEDFNCHKLSLNKIKAKINKRNK